jgi:Fungal specific transcription factor domain
MSFWFVDTEEKASSWHWLGTAISHAQTLGLHRDPDSGQRNPHLNDKSRPLWRRIWWSCFYRDRWLSLFMGRPMRINLRDCDIPMPSPDDIIGDFIDLPPAAWNKFIPCDFNLLAEGWIDFIRLSKTLGEILSTNYAPNSVKPTPPQIETFENEIYECSFKWNQRETKSHLHKFYASHFSLYQQ